MRVARRSEFHHANSSTACTDETNVTPRIRDCQKQARRVYEKVEQKDQKPKVGRQAVKRRDESTSELGQGLTDFDVYYPRFDDSKG